MRGTAVYVHLAQQQAQLQQLQHLNYQLWAQQAEDQRQRYLSDLLLSVTKGTERIEQTSGKDVLAAGILAHRWLQTTHWINASHFSDFDRKRTWDHCRQVLANARDRLWADPHASQIANAYLRIEDRVHELQGMLGRDAKATVNRWIVRARELEGWTKVWAIGFLVIFGLGFLTSFPALFTKESGGLLFVIWFFALPLAILCGVKWHSTRQQAAQTGAWSRHTSTCFVELEQLCSSENGWPFVERTRAEHPLLVYLPTPDPAPSQPRGPSHVLEKQTIERQVVVGRCKYCAALTPVDLSRCKNCGADKPI